MQFKIILVSNVVELGNFDIIYRSLSLHLSWDALEDPMPGSAKVDFNMILDSKVL